MEVKKKGWGKAGGFLIRKCILVFQYWGDVPWRRM